MTGFPENETKPAFSLFSLTLYSSGSSFGLWLALASVFLSLGFLFCALEVTAFNLLLVGVVVYFYRRQAYRPPLYIDDDGC